MLYRNSRPLFVSLRFSFHTTPLSRSSELANLLLLASVSKALINGGTRELEKIPFRVTDTIVLRILGKNISLAKKLDFFKWVSLKPGYKPSPNAYSQMLWAICRARNLEEVRPLLRRMKEEGIVLDSSTFKLLLDTFIRLGNFDWALELLEDMEELGCSLNPYVYGFVLVALVKKNQVNMAVSIFHRILVTDSVLPDCRACNELLIALRKGEMREEFKRVFSELRNNGFEFDTWGYNICIYAFGSWGDLGFALKLFNEMKKKGWNPDLCTYNSLIRVLCLVGRLNDALNVAEELKISGHEPDGFTYRILIQGCCKYYRVEEARKLFKEMQYNNFSPTVVVYNSLIDALFKARKMIDASQLFEKMVADGIKPTSWSYNILIDGLFKNGRAIAAYTLFCELKKKGQFVDVITYSIVILHLFREGRVEDSMKLVEEMEARGFVVDLVTLTSLLTALHISGRWDWAEQLMKHVRDSSILPNILRWTADMEASMRAPQDKTKDFIPLFPSKLELDEIPNLMKSSTLDESAIVDYNQEEVADAWSSSPYMDRLAARVHLIDHTKRFSLSRGQRVQDTGIDSFDLDMVNTYMAIFLARGKLSLACKLFEIFTQMGNDVISYTYNSLMTSFVKRGYFNEAWGVLHEMGEKLCPADIATYNVIIQGLGKVGRADLACTVLNQLLENGGYLDIVMYNTLINALGKAGRMDEANKMFQQMMATGINPDVVTFNTLIDIHTRAGRVKEAYKFLKMMIDAGCSPNHVTDTILDYLEGEIEKLRYKKASIKRNKEGLS